MRKRGLVLVLVLWPVAASASIVTTIRMEDMTRASSSIVIGAVRKVESKTEECMVSTTVDYDTVLALKGQAKSGRHTAWRFVWGPGCGRGPSRRLYACGVDVERLKAGDQAIFFDGSPWGSACDAPDRRAAIERVLAGRLTPDQWVADFVACGNADCPALAELGRLGRRALPALERALTRPDAQAQLLLWAVARVGGTPACTLVGKLWRGAKAPVGYLAEAAGKARCGALAKLVRARLADAETLDLFYLTQAAKALGDRRAADVMCARAVLAATDPSDARTLRDAARALGADCGGP